MQRGESMKDLAFVYPGQGTQYPGMGKNLYEENAVFKGRVDQANALLPFDLKQVMFESERVHETRYAQVALYVMQCALTDVLKEEGIHPHGTAGLSIGEYAAQYAAGVFDFETGLWIVVKRGELMQASAEASDTGMLAMLGTLDQAKAIVAAIDNVYIANHNMKKQVVLAGDKKALKQAETIGKEKGVKRFIPLKTAAAFHTPYMDDARKAFETFLEVTQFKDPKVPLYLNTTGKRYEKNLKATMVDQVTSPVYFHSMITTMIDEGYTRFVELGPGKTLATFIRKTDKSVEVITDIESEPLENFLKTLRSV
jgi:[acyl-carrier-protein] S-malonyltransferase